MKKFSVSVLIVASFFIIACKSTDVKPADVENDVVVPYEDENYNYSGEWFTEWLNVDEVNQDVYPSQIILEKTKNGFYEVNGNSGVNSFFGEIETDKNSIKVGENFGSTRMMGSIEEMDFEDNFMKCLLGAEKIQILKNGEGKYLIISNLSENMELGFRMDNQVQ